jgi:hypothetical protein
LPDLILGWPRDLAPDGHGSLGRDVAALAGVLALHAAVETMFHLIPALSRRLEALSAAEGPRIGAWHAARSALYLSWAGFGFLSRAVHRNSGRPELWALLPRG